MGTPLISVLIDTYNHEKYIEQCVSSAVEQDFPAGDYEVLVVDDGSTDRTPDIVRKFAPRVRLLQKKNGGQASAFNAACPELRGEFVALLDGDDWWMKSKVTVVAESFEKNPGDAAVGHAYYEFHEDACQIGCLAPEAEEVLTLDTPEQAAHAWHDWPLLVPCALTVRREVFARVVPIPEVLVFSADGPISAMAMAMRARVLARPLAYYRVHSANLNAIGEERDLAKVRRKYEMGAAMFDIVEGMLRRHGVQPDCVMALLDPAWVELNRTALHRLGGSRFEVLRTEMRSFRMQYRNPSLAYQIFKYAIVGAAASLLPPKQFYALWAWYGRQKLVRFPDSLRHRGQPEGGKSPALQ